MARGTAVPTSYPGTSACSCLWSGSDDNAPGGGGRIIFLGKAQQKNNKQAVPLAPGAGGAPTKLTLTQFFGGLIAPTNPDGSVNEGNINCHLGLGPRPAIPCDSTNPPLPTDSWHPQDACVDEFYDARVFYRADDKRFVVVAHARNAIYSTADWMKKTQEDFDDHRVTAAGIQTLYNSGPEARRYIAIAVSRSEDPRDGFNEYITTTSNYADWPLAAVGENGIVAGHRSPPESGKPAIYLVLARPDGEQRGRARPTRSSGSRTSAVRARRSR